jgi:hypothetical protein
MIGVGNDRFVSGSERLMTLGGTNMKSGVCIALVLGFFLSALPAIAADPSCRELEREYVGKMFITKEPLYDTVIGYAGVIKLERDKEEIRPGATVHVKDIECGGNRVEVTLKQVTDGREHNKVEIRFRINKIEREAAEGMNDFRKMWAYVLDDVAPEGESTSGSELF